MKDTQAQLPLFPAVFVMSYTIFFSVLNGVSFNLAVPDIAGEFGLQPQAVSLVISLYVALFALGSAVYARLAQQIEVRILIVLGILVFCLGSLLGLLSDSYFELLLARALQAAGVAGVPALSMYLATVAFGIQNRGRVLGTISATVAFAAGIGPIAGGALAGLFGWRVLFALPFLTLPAALAYWKVLPDLRPADPDPFDLPGALYLALIIGGVLGAVSQPAPWNLLGLVLAIIGTLGFVRRIRTADHPFIPVELFDLMHFRRGLLVVFGLMCSVMSMMFLVPLMLRQLYDLSTIELGWYLFPAAMIGAIMGYTAGRQSDRRGSYPIVLAGFLMLGAGLAGLGIVAGHSALAVALVMLVAHSGFSTVHSSLAKAVADRLPGPQVGLGMGFFNLVFFAAGAMGASGSALLLEGFSGPWAGVSLPVAYQLLWGVLVALVALVCLIFASSFRPGKAHEASGN